MATETTPSTTAAPAASAAPKPAAAKQDAKEEIKVEVKAEETKAPADPAARIGRADAIIQRNVLWSLGAGLLPLPLLDLVLSSGVQIKMLKELSDLYEVKFTDSIVKKILASLVSSLGGVAIGTALGASITKLVPVVGTALGVAASPIFVGTFTYTTGRVFLMHFESGGTFLDFDPVAMRKYFREEFEKAKERVAQIHKEEQAKAAAKPA
jgi:uncharacterized protein (DUF697 family)